MSYAADRGEEHFTYSRYSGRRIWWDVIRAITANDPLGLCGWMDIDGKDKAHWVAVKGWHWSTAHGRRVLVTDSYCESDNRELCWDALNAPAPSGSSTWFAFAMGIDTPSEQVVKGLMSSA